MRLTSHRRIRPTRPFFSQSASRPPQTTRAERASARPCRPVAGWPGSWRALMMCHARAGRR
eukprot:6824066-Alexandrium_andersonii.AAC.1